MLTRNESFTAEKRNDCRKYLTTKVEVDELEFDLYVN